MVTPLAADQVVHLRSQTTDLVGELAFEPTRGDLDHVASCLHSGLVQQVRQRMCALGPQALPQRLRDR